MIGFPASSRDGAATLVGVTLIEGFPLIIFQRPAWGRRTPYGKEFPGDLGGFLPDLRLKFWGPWGIEKLLEYARREVESLTRVIEWEVVYE